MLDLIFRWRLQLFSFSCIKHLTLSRLVKTASRNNMPSPYASVETSPDRDAAAAEATIDATAEPTLDELCAPIRHAKH